MPDIKDAPVPTDAPAPERTNSVLDALFDGKPAPEKKVEEKPESKDEPEPKKTETPKAPEKKEEESDTPGFGEEDKDEEVEGDSKDAGGDEDYDAPLKKEEKPKKKEESEAPLQESVAQKMAKEKGRKVKELEAVVRDKDIEFGRVFDENKSLKAQIEELRAVKVKPTEHPDFLALKDKVWNEVETAAEVIPEGRDIPKHFGVLSDAYAEATALRGDERAKAMAELRKTIVNKCGKFDVEYEDMDATDLREADQFSAKVLSILQKTAPDVRGLVDLSSTLSSKSEESAIVLSLKDYDAKVKDINPILDAIGNMPEEAIDADPHAIESVVATLAKTSEGRRRLTNAKRDALEALFGPRPYTKEELAQLKGNGTDLKSHEAERRKKADATRKRLLPKLVQFLVAGATLVEDRRSHMAAKAEVDQEEAEADAVRGATRPAKPKKQEAVRPSERKNYGMGRFTDD